MQWFGPISPCTWKRGREMANCCCCCDCFLRVPVVVALSYTVPFQLTLIVKFMCKHRASCPSDIDRTAFTDSVLTVQRFFCFVLVFPLSLFFVYACVGLNWLYSHMLIELICVCCCSDLATRMKHPAAKFSIRNTRIMHAIYFSLEHLPVLLFTHACTFVLGAATYVVVASYSFVCCLKTLHTWTVVCCTV